MNQTQQKLIQAFERIYSVESGLIPENQQQAETQEIQELTRDLSRRAVNEVTAYIQKQSWFKHG